MKNITTTKTSTAAPPKNCMENIITKPKHSTAAPPKQKLPEKCYNNKQKPVTAALPPNKKLHEKYYNNDQNLVQQPKISSIDYKGISKAS